MANNRKKVTGFHVYQGSVLLMVIFVVALLATVVTGILEMNTEEIQLMQNHVYAAQAMAIAEAGLNDAFAQIRQDATWTQGFQNKSFVDGSYTVTVADSHIESVGTTDLGYIAQVEADIVMGDEGPPYSITIEAMRINE